MRNLALAITREGVVGEEVPTPFRSLDEVVKLRTQEMVVLAGAPGGGKSTFAVNLAHAVDYPVLYVAQDSVASVVSRLTALELGAKVDDVREGLEDAEERELIIKAAQNIRKTLVIEGGPVTAEKLNLMVDALTEWLGAAPPLVILDNLIDTIVPGRTYHEAAFYADTLPKLKAIAHEHNTCMMVLHHVTRSGDGKEHGLGNKPIRMSDLLYAGERTARHVLGAYVAGEREIRIQVLKQQDGIADPGGGIYVPFRWFPEHCKLVGS